MKLYIPTTTLNFNNIMSSESISPASFYTKRQFGYKRFEKVEPNNLDNRIILYDKYPEFHINNKELESYPMVIEVDTKTIKEDALKEYKDGVYYSEETIYLNPFTTKIFFGNENEKRSTLSKAEPSIETKMVPIYENRFCKKNSDIKDFEWKNIKIEDTTADNSTYISKDCKINKLKGFLYAYILAANKSLSIEVVALKKYTKELRNILSAVITSPDGKATYKQDEQLNILYKAINNALYRAEGLDKKLKEIISQKQEYYKIHNFTEILQGEGLFDFWQQQQNLKQSFKLQSFNFYQKEKEKALDKYISLLDIQINNYANKNSIMIIRGQFPELQYCRKIESIPEKPDKEKFLSDLFNEYLAEAYNSDGFIQSRYDFAFAGGKIFRDTMPSDKWESSPIRKYINGLLSNLKDYSAFEINSGENLTLKSFAAFCQKGESDIDKLEDYLISNEIGDFRIAFSLWGIVFGFANMPKTLTKDLFSSNDLEYISEIYKYIFMQVHGIPLEGKLENKFVTVLSKINEIPNSDVSNKNTLEQELSKFEEYNLLKPNIKKQIISKFNGIGIYSLDKWNFEKATTIEWNPKNNGQKKLITAINKTKLKSNSKNNKLIQRDGIVGSVKSFDNDLFLSSSKEVSSYGVNTELKKEKEFYKDDNAWNYIKDLKYGSDKIKKDVKKNLDTIQKGYRENGYYQKRGDSNENKKVIDHFLKYCVSDKNKYNQINQNDFPIHLQNEIQTILESKYE